jgi:TolB-like protein
MNGADGGLSASHAFGRWRFDADTGNLFDGDTTIRLEPQVAKLLDYFLTHQDTLVTRDELIAAVWDGRIVSDDAINRCISILRQTLSPDDKNAVIETVVRRGFISHFPPPSGDVAELAEPARNGKPWVLALLVGVLAVLVWGALDRFGAEPEPARVTPRDEAPMVAVLPFVTAGLAGDSEFFANGMHDDLLTQLAQLESIRVISRTSVYPYRDSERSIREIGRELGADAILEGGVQQVGDHIRLNVQLIDAHSDVHLWAEQYDRELSPASIFAIQAEIARAIASALQATLTEEDASQLKVLPTDNMAAYRAFHEAMELRDTYNIAAPAQIAALEKAVALDPDFVRAWAELAGALSFANFGRPDPEAMQRVERILEHIRTLAPDSADYAIAQTYFAYYLLQDFELAFELVKQAQSLRPSDANVVELKSWIQRRLGDFDGRIESVRLARTLDPRSPRWTVSLVGSLITVHRYDEAMQEIEQSPDQVYDLAVMRILLLQRERPDPSTRLGEMLRIQREFQAAANPFDLWEAHIAAGDYRGAEDLLSSMQRADLADNFWAIAGLTSVELPRIVTYRFLDANDRLGQRVAEVRTRLEQNRDAGQRMFEVNQNLAMAVVTAAEGNTDETRRFSRIWLREAPADQAELARRRQIACRALGMAGATADAVGCIRSGLAEPSLVMPFIEPYLPYYDSVRDDPEFAALLNELGSDQNNMLK